MKKQTDIEDAIKKTEGNGSQKKQNSAETKINRPALWSSCCPYRLDVPYVDDLPSLTRQEFSDECDINLIMKKYEATGIMPTGANREPIYWDADAIPNNLQDAMGGMLYAQSLFMQLGANIRKEFDNDPVKFVDFALQDANRPKLIEWGLTEPETPAQAPVRVEVVTPNPPPASPPGEAPKA